MDDAMTLGRGVTIPLAEVELRTSRSSGPGGQHANVTASRVEAIFDVEASRSLSEDQKRRIGARHGPVVRAVAQDTRSQSRNRELALERLRARLEAALVVPRDRAVERGAPPAPRVEATPRRGQAVEGTAGGGGVVGASRGSVHLGVECTDGAFGVWFKD
jgi:ribosome-associated protein